MGGHGDLVDADELRAFDAVATKRSFSLAAAELGCSQSTISQRVARLERRLHCILIRRSTRKVELTADGEAMLIYARSILSISHEVRMRLAQPGLKGILKVGIEDEFPWIRVPEVLGIFRRQFPEFGLKCITGRNEHLRDALRTHDIDIILGKSLTSPDSAALWQEQLVWVGHPSLELGASDPVPLISYLEPSLTRSFVEGALQAHRRSWVNVAECSNLHGVLAAARSGIGVAVVGQSFRKSVLQEVPAAAALPPLGQVAYVIEGAPDHSAAVAFRVVVSEVAKRSMQPAGTD